MTRDQLHLRMARLDIPDPDGRFTNYARVTFGATVHPDQSPESFVQRDDVSLHILVKLQDPQQTEAEIIDEAWGRLALRLEILAALAKNNGRIMKGASC